MASYWRPQDTAEYGGRHKLVPLIAVEPLMAGALSSVLKIQSVHYKLTK
jgi:hypothetical protein